MTREWENYGCASHFCVLCILGDDFWFFFSFKWVRGCALKQKKSQSGLSHVHGPKIRGLLVALSPAHQRLGGTSKIPPKQHIRLATIPY